MSKKTEKIKEAFGLSTVRKKVLLLSKLAGGMIVFFYLITIELSSDGGAAFFMWFVLMAAVIVGVDVLLGRMISKPLNKINDTASQMAKLDLTACSDVNTNDEFEELSHSLNVMSGNLQDALEKLEIANARLEKDVEQERFLLAQRKELSDSLSHEMKTPLGLIRAYAEGLKDETDEAKKEQYLDAILSASDRMNGMIVTLLDLSALEAGAAKLTEEDFDFIELVETVAGCLLLSTPVMEYQLNYQLPEEKIFVHCDKQRLEQVVNNLIENARKHVCNGGEIRLEVRQSGRNVHFSIYNQGKIISEQEMSKIWKKFYRCKDGVRNGSGLGLAIVAQILSIYEAPYGVENKKDGVEFYFSFQTASL